MSTTIGDLVSARLESSILSVTVMGRKWIVIAVNALRANALRANALRAGVTGWVRSAGAHLLLLSLVTVLLVSIPAPAGGATVGIDPDEPMPTVSAQPDANDIPSETVSRFVTAYIAVVQLIESRELGLQRAETDTESRQMQQEIQAAALDLIQANDLTLSDYWELLGLANSDPEFRDRVLAQIDEAIS